MQKLLLAALPLAATAQHFPGDPFNVQSFKGNFTLAPGGVDFRTADGAAHFNERGLVRVTVTGTINKQISDGNVQYTFYEKGVTGKESSGSFGYFKCNKQNDPPCDPAQPMYLKIDKPKDMVGSQFTFSAPVQLPYKQKTGQMTLSLIGTDQDHTAEADFTIDIAFNYTSTVNSGIDVANTLADATEVGSGGQTRCKSNKDCPSSSCRKFPFHRVGRCRDCGKNCCNSDADCPGSYCMNDPSKTAPYSCHAGSESVEATLTTPPLQGGGKTVCKQDVDCPSSYCMNGDGKSKPYHCHDCGPNCCNSDADCPGSYCNDDPTKQAPFTCH